MNDRAERRGLQSGLEGKGRWVVGWLVDIKGNEFRVTLGEGRDQVGFCGRRRRKSIG